MKKFLAEDGRLVTSLVRLPQTVVSSPHYYLRIIISHLQTAEYTQSILLSFFQIKIFWNLAFFLNIN